MSMKAGDTHIILHASNGKVYTFGLNDYMQCCNSENEQFTYCPPKEVYFTDAATTTDVNIHINHVDASPRTKSLH